MNDTTLAAETQDIVVDEVLPHGAGIVWKALTEPAFVARWLMAPTGFAPVEGCRFTMQTKAGGAWDGVIHCEVLEVRPNARLVYSWKGGHPENVGYGSPLDTIVTWTLSEEPAGTRVRIVHSGFKLPINESALRTMGEGWRKVLPRMRVLVDEEERA